MKKIFLIIIFATIAFESQAIKPSDVKAANAKIIKADDMLIVEFEVITTNFSSNQKVKLTPIVYNGNNSFKTLEPMTLVGRKRNVYDKRAKVSDDEGIRTVVKGKKRQAFGYSASVPYEDWMQYISLSVDMIFEGCCTQTNMLMQNITTPQLTHYEPILHFDTIPLPRILSEFEQFILDNLFLHPMENHPKRYEIMAKKRSESSSEIIFTVGSHRIDMNSKDNKETVAAMKKAFKFIDEEPGITLEHITITGYASPDGSLALNTSLAQRRALAVKEFIKSLLTNPSEELFEVINGREDWDGLRELVDNSNMPYKDEALEIIDSHTMEQEIRKTKLKQLHGGVPYKYMLNNFFPALRSAGYAQVYYEISHTPAVSSAEANERGNAPDNRGVMAINKALEYMLENKFDEALESLLEFKDDPRTWNNIGVCCMMTGRYDEADAYLVKAVENGDENAAKNIEELNWLKKVKL